VRSPGGKRSNVGGSFSVCLRVIWEIMCGREIGDWIDFGDGGVVVGEKNGAGRYFTGRNIIGVGDCVDQGVGIKVIVG